VAATPRKPSQRDIARIAGVSQAAVSMVLNGKADAHNLAPATQDRVRETIASLGYVPNISGRSLRGGRNGLIGVHTYQSVFPVVPDDYFHEFLVGIEGAAVKARQDLVLFASTERADGTRRIYGEGGNRLRIADGSVILGVEPNTEDLERLAGEGYPFVFIGRRDAVAPSVPYVTADYAGAVREIVEQFAAAGHRRVSYLGITERFEPQKERFDAFHDHLAVVGMVAGPDLLTDPEHVTTDLVRSALHSGSTAILAETVEMAEALSAVAASLSVTIPEDLSVALLDPPSRALRGWSHMVVPRQEMGARAVDALLALLAGELEPGHIDRMACPVVGLGTIAPPRREASAASQDDRQAGTPAR
jgi:DNA-binding LacI/PurR family transcriptional regulator